MKLIVCRGGAERAVDFGDAREVVIGRSPSSDVQLKDRLVSRRHCRIVRGEGTLRVEDLGSVNGTLVNGVRITETVLSRGDAIDVGGTRIYFEEVRGDTSATDVDLRIDRVVTSLAEGRTVSARDVSPVIVERLRWQTQNLLRLQSINKEINSELDLDRLLERIVDSVVELTGAERGFLILRREDELEFEVARHCDGSSLTEPELEVSRSIAREVMRSGRPVVAINAQEDDRLKVFQSVADLGIRSVLCAPLVQRGRVIGVIYIDSRIQQGMLSRDHAGLLEAFADQAAIAIRNARLYKELRERNEELARSQGEIEWLNRRLCQRVELQEVELRDVRERLEGAQSQLEHKYNYRNIVGSSPKMQEVFRLLDKVIDSDIPVLIQGESGTGKELITRAIHFNGPRRKGRFIAENCSALPDTLLESELFGHVKGAFTGATKTKQGLFELADKGTLFLDEVGDMSPEMQKKLLRVLEEKQIRPVGGSQAVAVDVRVLSASNRDLAELVREGTFREDLYYRLSTLPILVPPLRDRLDDIPELVRHFVARLSEEGGLTARGVEEGVMEAFLGYSWPGNVRELENEIRRMLLLGEGSLRTEHLSKRICEGGSLPSELPSPSRPGEVRNLVALVARIERSEIERALEIAQGNKSRAAELLGISRFTLQRKLDKHGIGSG